MPAGPRSRAGRTTTATATSSIVDEACRLWELYGPAPSRTGGGGRVGRGLGPDSNALRPAGWTSADAAGLPILPGLVRYDEVAAGEIDHAIRMTVPRPATRYIWPARHQAGEAQRRTSRRWALRFRLKASVDVRLPAAPR